MCRSAEGAVRDQPAVRGLRHRREPGAVREPGHPAQLRRSQAGVVRPAGRTAAQHRTDRTTGMTALWKTIVKVGVFGVVMILLTAALFAIFGQYRSGSDNSYSAVFADAS